MFDSVHGHQFFITERKKNLEVISRKKNPYKSYIETAEKISLKILLIGGLLLACIGQDNTCLLGLKGLKIPKQGTELSTWKERGLTAGKKVICQHL